jgi:hypothetical protein
MFWQDYPTQKLNGELIHEKNPLSDPGFRFSIHHNLGYFRRQGMNHHLFFGFKGESSIFIANEDGTVELECQLD